MKYLAVFIVAIMIWDCNNDTSPKNIEEINYSKYLSRPVESLLNDLNQKHTDCIFFDEPPGFLQGAYFCYPDSIVIEIIVDKFEYVEQFDTARTWNYDAFIKEKISRIKISKNNKVLNNYTQYIEAFDINNKPGQSKPGLLL